MQVGVDLLSPYVQAKAYVSLDIGFTVDLRFTMSAELLPLDQQCIRARDCSPKISRLEKRL